MRTMTITEALAELKTLDKRIAKKRESVGQYLMRQDAYKDPMTDSGGSRAFVSAERQAIGDLENNVVAIKTGIQRVNNTTQVVVTGVTRSITEWLVWRRDIAPSAQKFIATLRDVINKTRQQAMQKGVAVLATGAAPATPNDIIVNLDEKALTEEAEALENTLGTLDGLLSLKNATVTIDVP